MTEFTATGPGNGPSDILGTVKDKAASSVQELKNTAANVKGVSAEALKEHAAKAVDSAKELASEAGDKLNEQIADKKNASADYAKTFADSLRRAAGEFDDQVPLAGRYIRSAAHQVEAVSESVRNGNVGDLVKGAQDFARRQPTAFLGLTVLVGFGLVRFLKSSGGSSNAAIGSAGTSGSKGAA